MGDATELLQYGVADTCVPSSLTMGCQGYPMYLIPVSTFLEMSEWAPHQELLKDGHLKEWTAECASSTFFISHQWTSFSHPDPKGAQLRALQAVLRKLAKGGWSTHGNHVVSADYGVKQGRTRREWQAMMREAYLWIDYTSMPQPLAVSGTQPDAQSAHAGLVHADHRIASRTDTGVADVIAELKAAVDSIPSYVERCAEVMVLTIPVAHVDKPGEACDFNSWRSRGWCRLEFICTRLCTTDKPVLVISSHEEPPSYFNLCDTDKLRPGTGAFTVDEDRHKVARVLRSMANAKADGQRRKGNLGLARLLYMGEPRLLSGLPEASHDPSATPIPANDCVSEAARAVARLKHAIGWRGDATEAAWVAETGLSLLHVAAARADLGAARALLAIPLEAAFLNKAVGNVVALDSPDSGEGMGNMLLMMMTQGNTPLMLAVGCADSAASEMVALLVGAGADASACGDLGENMYHMAVGNSHEVLATYIECAPAEADINQPGFEDMTPLHELCRWGNFEEMQAKVELLLEHGAVPSVNMKDVRGSDPLGCLARNPEADPAVVRLLIDAGADPLMQEPPSAALRRAIRLPIPRSVAVSLACKASAFASVGEYIQERGGGGPMHFAAFRGDGKMVQALADAGVPVDVPHRVLGKMPSKILADASPDKVVPAPLEKLLQVPSIAKGSRQYKLSRRSKSFAQQSWSSAARGRAGEHVINPIQV